MAVPVYLRIRNFIKEKGLTFRSVAARTEIKESRFYPLMNGEKTLHADEIEDICRNGLGVEPEIFFNHKFSETKNSDN